ncbi:hypothetical protein GCM10023340_04550 [Nocardioides marinquilinus]|uniref:STAS domain-containing protein n=1 Tax=Nocardioides marinquilinus TaxID=1210400 RepID=A0ABP9P7L4_9ACTN
MTIITARPDEIGVTLLVAGDLDVAGAWDVRQCVSSLAGDGVRRFDVDLRAVDFVDSSGMGQLARYWAAAGADGVGLRLAAASDRFWDLARATGRRHHFDFVEPLLAS